MAGTETDPGSGTSTGTGTGNSRRTFIAGAAAVGEITGLPPAVSLEQRRSAPGARSSVGTVTTLSNSLRLLFS
ncbi:hypothetical protein ACFWBF_13630, partial [Streptomyces sp. NPDC060028]|uniref:hypothetical protein n=1 Tax=Streptomyces sp. NPDC060028 TaxID=3347041 RepID=UPI0036BAB38D